MNSSPHQRPRHPEATFREAGLDELAKDLFRFGPAPTRSREAFVSIVSVLLAGALVAVTRPTVAGAGLIAGVVGLYVAVRWLIGTRTWGAR